MDLSHIMAPIDDFSDSNKLGKGGFGSVYKGVLPDGMEVAVKRLSRKSWQGMEELENELILIAKLQHINLLKLLGCAIEIRGRGKAASRNALSLTVRHAATSLMVLPEVFFIFTRTPGLKPSNILLDHEDQNMANTRRVVGTYGYMAPEYAMEGIFSVKNDVFSFGVILLEITSGKRNSGFYLTKHAQTLIEYAWRLWNEGKELEFPEPLLMESCLMREVLKCMHIGLLCLQEDPAERPSMSSAVVLLGNEAITLPEPKHPAFSVGGVCIQSELN